MARYSELKTHMMEHHWLQNPRADCVDGVEGPYDGCQPYMFNSGFESNPAALYYDGHVGLLSVRQARLDDRRASQGAGSGLWSRDTPLGDYFLEWAYDEPAGPESGTCYHILTTWGIRGRDTLK